MRDDVLIVTQAELQILLGLSRATNDLIESAFTALAQKDVIMPPVMSMDIPHINAEVDVKTAYIPGFDGFAIKVSPGFFDNPNLGLPSLNGLMMLLSARTGLAKAVFLDNGYLTDLRTAAAGGVAARHLAPKHVKTVGVIGTGAQARLQVEAAYHERKFEKVLVCGRNDDHARKCAKDIADKIGVPTYPVAAREELVRQSQLVITTTPSRVPLIDAEWLHPNLHITAMGSDQAGKTELDPQILPRADRFVCDRVSQCIELGELAGAIDAGAWDIERTPIELGDLVVDPSLGRQSDSEITVCDLTGTGAQDTAIANYAYDLARAKNMGTPIKSHN
ncbi:cyclodeaminase [Maritalea porphyrae]|uniref:Cyclodeaminase n=1 Tax=Maritalea porphyrae TaxID=880732 RepID=A0ABQ5URH3_9HYPH|nr:cyclodeaminase [Maritalea porphyrae]GLQ17701.1 cyclodeaminase [Maritalea porphyrae]